MLFVLVVVVFLSVGGCAKSGVFHTVRDGQTLYRISRVYGVDELYLARINGVSDPTRLKSGTRIFIPGVEQTRDIPAAAAASTAATRPVAAETPTQPPKVAPAKKSTTTKAAPAKTVAPATVPPAVAAHPAAPAVSLPVAVAPHFVWPLRGSLLRRFGDTGTPPSKGLEIAAATGTPVAAAAAGKVIYSGDGIRSYGNLIIIRHDDAFFTVYGYNERNLVSAGAFVSKGEQIALAGAPPAGGKPRLYFEIRRGKDAVNPTIYLP